MEKYILVKSSDIEYINIIYKILRESSFNLAKKFLFHWLPVYSKRKIKKDCLDKSVFLVWDGSLNSYTSTFQIYKLDENKLCVRKIATLPDYEGRGIGCRNIMYIENYAKDLGRNIITLDVYEKSLGAILFYKKMGFEIVGTKRSLRFKEFVMEKVL